MNQSNKSGYIRDQRIADKNIHQTSSLELYETLGVVVAMAPNIAARVSRVVMPMVTRPGTWSSGMKRENQPMITNKPEGRYVRNRW